MKKKPKAANKDLPGNEEPTSDEQSAAEKAAEREAKVADARKRIERCLKAFPLFYDASGEFWFKLNRRFLKMSRSDIKDHLKSDKCGLRDSNKDRVYVDGVPEIDWPFVHAQINKVIDYTGPLAGHRVGTYHVPGKTFLITTEAEGVWDDLPTPKFPPLFGAFVKALLPDDQWRHFCYWLALSFRSLRTVDFKPGMCVFLVGKPKCGKSLCQHFVKLILGGRSGNPVKYMTEATDFNGDIICAEVWSAEDPRSSSDYKSREAFGDSLKEAANNDTIRCEKKFGEGIEVRIWRRVLFSLNMLPQHIQRIPPMIEGTEDKVSVYKCADARHTLNRFIVTEEQTTMLGGEAGESVPIGLQDRAALQKAIEAEVPLIRAWLLSEFRTVPEAFRDDRADIRAYQHPEIVAIINDLSREAHLMSLIDTYAWKKNEPDQPPITGTAGEVYAELIGKCQNIGTIVRSPIAMGQLLEALKQQRKDGRVMDRMKPGNIRSWTITPPPEITQQKPKEGNPY